VQRSRTVDGATWLALAFSVFALAALGVVAVLLANAQSNQRSDQRERYSERAEIATGLIYSLFQVAFAGQSEQAGRRFRTGTATTAQLDAYTRSSNALWTVLVEGERRIVARSSAAPATLDQRAQTSAALGRALRGGIGVSNVHRGSAPYIITNVAFPTRRGRLVLAQASPLKVYSDFLDQTLARLPRVNSGSAYVLDASGMVVGRAGATGARAPADLVRASARTHDGTIRGRYFAASAIPATQWRTVVDAPEDELYGAIGGTSLWLPWALLGLGTVTLLAIALLLRRLVRTAALLRRANADLGHSNAELARSNADLEQFAYAASHDLSEPLRTVAGFSQLLQRRYEGELDAEADLFIHHMSAGVERMQQLIDDLLLYSRVGRAPVGRAHVHLDEVLGEALHAIEPATRERGAQITAGELPTVVGEHGQLRQVLQNLLVNALKFTAPDVTPRVHVDAERDGGSWKVTVRDNGIGVPAEQRDAIFKMFGRLHPGDAFPGTGIGLALVKRIVERHGGDAWVESGPGGGSTFAFTLPDRARLVEPAAEREGVSA
jgi:signal transduction histidine kinase